ncbi:MAG TPA: sugar phosphate isomerase/epimerase [Thermoprotei archaeon]|nr:sugar phosphate isomerase/epimerase [Thermoprotei archaeon]
MKISLQEGLLIGKTFSEKLVFGENIGIDGVELGGRNLGERINEIKEALSTSKLKISSICSGYPGDLLGLTREERETAIKGIIERLKYAGELGATGLIVVPTFGKPKLPDLYPLYRSVIEFERKVLIAELKILNKYALEYGSSILLEPLNRYETHFLNKIKDAVSIVEEAGGDGIRIMADFFHMNIEERDIAESLKYGLKYLMHIHLADSNRLAPGFGHTDFRKPFKVLKNGGYKYYMAYECRIPEPYEESLRKSLSYIREILGEV